MATFYDDWLAAGERIQEEFRRSPMIAHDQNIPWVSTRQDAKVKLMVANELGFPTMGIRYFSSTSTEQISPDSAGPFTCFDPVGFAIFATTGTELARRFLL